MQCHSKLEHLKTVTNGYQHTRTTKNEKIYILNKGSHFDLKILKYTNPSKKGRFKYKCSFDLLVSYHDFQVWVK